MAQSQQLATIWQNAASLMKNEISELIYTTFIKEMEPMELTDTNVIFRVPDEFYKGHIESRYKALIANALRLVTDKVYNVQITTRDEAIRYEQEPVKDGLNPKYIFEDFVVGDSNRMAFAAAVAVAESPLASAYNPLFIYGGVGLGKTHLISAIGNRIKKLKPSTKVLYVSSEAFTNDLMNAIKANTNEKFRERYRHNDVLIIDDIQFIIGKESTQLEIFHTFNALYENNKQVIISSDKHAKALSPLEDRLKSRFASGLIVDIQPPEYETRKAILEQITKRNKLDIPNDVLNMIALKILTNNRELESILNKVVLFSKNLRKEVDIETATLALSNELGRNRPTKLDCNIICEAVSRYYDMDKQDLFSKKKSREYSYPRQVAMYLCRELCDISYPNIGKAFGGKDHTTIMHGVQKITRLYDEESRIRKEVDEIKKNHLGRE